MKNWKRSGSWSPDFGKERSPASCIYPLRRVFYASEWTHRLCRTALIRPLISC
jgi:hypothetical protein